MVANEAEVDALPLSLLAGPAKLKVGQGGVRHHAVVKDHKRPPHLQNDTTVP
jgi:hypothetical protein